MGEHNVQRLTDEASLRRFARQLIQDVRALEHMLGEGTFETGVDLSNYTGTFSMRRIYYRGALTSDPSSGSSGSFVDTNADFIVDEHNNRLVIMCSGRKMGTTYSLTDTTVSGSLQTTANIYSSGVRSGDEFYIYTTKVDGNACSITNAAEGQFEYRFTGTETDTPGDYEGEFRFSNTATAGRVIHFPTGNESSSKLKITISAAFSV